MRRRRDGMAWLRPLGCAVPKGLLLMYGDEATETDDLTCRSEQTKCNTLASDGKKGSNFTKRAFLSQPPKEFDFPPTICVSQLIFSSAAVLRKQLSEIRSDQIKYSCSAQVQ
jgi:hypothetical protein